MAPKPKREPVGELTSILFPGTILLVIIVALLWGVTRVNEAIPIEIWSMGSGMIIGGLAIIAVVYNKYA